MINLPERARGPGFRRLIIVSDDNRAEDGCWYQYKSYSRGGGMPNSVAMAAVSALGSGAPRTGAAGAVENLTGMPATRTPSGRSWSGRSARSSLLGMDMVPNEADLTLPLVLRASGAYCFYKHVRA